MNDNSPERRWISNLREPSFAPSADMIAAMLDDKLSVRRMIALTNTRLQNSQLVSDAALAMVAHSIVDSDPVLSTFAASEWNELCDDGKQWIIAIVRETLRRVDLLKPVDGGHHD